MIKTFEQYQEYRSVNLVQFFKDFEKYEKQLEGSVMSHVRNMLMYKKVSFQDSVMREGTSGTVKEINYNINKGNSSSGGSFPTNEFLSIYFEEDKNTRTFNLKYRNFQHSQKWVKSGVPIIKIWDSQKTPIEEQIDMIKDAEKYNI